MGFSCRYGPDRSRRGGRSRAPHPSQFKMLQSVRPNFFFNALILRDKGTGNWSGISVWHAVGFPQAEPDSYRKS